MKVTQVQSYNQNYRTPFGSQKLQSSTSFTGLGSSISKGYDNFVEGIAKKYYVGFYNSGLGRGFAKMTDGKKWASNMTTHMSVLGSTLISGMYVVRTLSNDKLDEKRRKTLAINDALTWGVSTAGMYFADKKLGNWWEGVTTRFAANYLLDNPDAKRKDLFGEWDAKDLKIMMKKWHEKILPASEEGQKLLKNLKNSEGKFDAYKSIRDFNLDILQQPKLTTYIDGMDVLKKLAIFGMIYRYIVPVLVMKPANKIGKMLHDKNEAKNQQQNQAVEKK